MQSRVLLVVVVLAGQGLIINEWLNERGEAQGSGVVLRVGMLVTLRRYPEHVVALAQLFMEMHLSVDESASVALFILVTHGFYRCPMINWFQ